MAGQLLVEHISKNFNGLQALDDVNLTLNQGEILGLIGPNGSGKTTLINVISGLLPATSGKLFVGGEEITNYPAYKIAHHHISRTFQTIRLFRELTVQENVEAAAVGIGFSRKVAREKAMNTLKEMNLEGYAELLAGTLPYGLERRLEIARALAMDPVFVLLDEPGAGLNEEESSELLILLDGIRNKHNLGMMVVEHDMRLIMGLCDRLHVLQSGKTIGEGTPSQIREDPKVIEAYLGESETEG